MYGLAGPLEVSTISWRVPRLMDLRFRPERASFLSLLNSGSNGWREATSSQSIPRSPMELTTQLRSAVAASAFAADAARLAKDAESSWLEIGTGFEFELESATDETATGNAAAAVDEAVEDASAVVVAVS